MQSTDDIVTISLTGRLGYSDTITVDQAIDILRYIRSSSTPASPLISPRAAADPIVIEEAVLPLGPVKAIADSPREALEASGASTNAAKIVALAAHFMKNQGREVFALDDVKPLFQRAREATPTNIGRDLGQAIKNGWVAQGNEKDEFYVTASGHRTLESRFLDLAGERKGSPSRKVSTASRKKKLSAPDSLSRFDEIPSSVDGYPPFRSMKTNLDRMLWALLCANDLGLQGAESCEIEFITDHLGHGLPTKDISSYFKRNKAKGFVNKAIGTQKIRLTPEGEEHLRNLLGGT